MAHDGKTAQHDDSASGQVNLWERHFHYWTMADGARMMYRAGPPFRTRQAADQYARRREPIDTDRWVVMKCDGAKCRAGRPGGPAY